MGIILNYKWPPVHLEQMAVWSVDTGIIPCCSCFPPQNSPPKAPPPNSQWFLILKLAIQRREGSRGKGLSGKGRRKSWRRGNWDASYKSLWVPACKLNNSRIFPWQEWKVLHRGIHSLLQPQASLMCYYRATQFLRVHFAINDWEKAKAQVK